MSTKENDTSVSIVVTDKAGSLHTFTGTIRFWHEGQICRVWNVVNNITLGSFTDPISVVLSCKELVSVDTGRYHCQMELA